MILSNKSIVRRIHAAELLINSSLFEESVVLYWQIIRHLIFNMLYQKGLEFKSTDEALVLFFTQFIDNQDLTRSVQSFESIATLCEWDIDFKLSESNAFQMKTNFDYITKELNLYV